MSDVISVQISGVITRIICCFLSRSKAFEKVLSKTFRRTVPRRECDNIRKFVRQEFFVSAEIILDRLNSFHPQLQFTNEFFTDD